MAAPVVTLFALATCPHCIRAKRTLQKLGLPYGEISLSDHSDRRADMVALAASWTVPQVFFHNTHIGNADRLEALAEDESALAEKLEEAQREMDSGVPRDARLTLPPAPTEEEVMAREQAESAVAAVLEAAAEKPVAYQHLHEELMSHAQGCLTTTVQGEQVLRACKFDSELANAVVGSGLVRLAAKSGGKRVGVGTAPLDKSATYVFAEGQIALNERFVFVPSKIGHKVLEAARPFDTLTALKKALEKAEAMHYDDEGRVDAAAVVKDKGFQDYERQVCVLQDPSLFGWFNQPHAKPKGATVDADNYKLAFTINLYNMIVRHAMLRRGVASTNWARLKWFDAVTVNVGGRRYSLNDLENGVLRMNSKTPFHFSKHNVPSPLSKREPRIHFALNCGARSCPPVKLFTPFAVRQELEIATQAFLEMDENMQVEGQVLRLSKIFSWYKSDFGDVKDFVLANGRAGEPKLEMLRGANRIRKVEFLFYDWATNLKNAKQW